MNRYPRYPAYKPSGVDWLGEIPAHWDTIKAKWIWSEVNDKNHPEEPLLSVTQENGVISRQDSELRVWNPGDNVTGYKLIQPNDFVISLRSFEGGIEYSRVRGIVSPAYTVLRTYREIHAEYYRYLLKSEPLIAILNAITKGIRQGKTIAYSDFAELVCPVPNLTEQKIIAATLDRQTAVLDALIAEKQALIGLLQEKRAAVIGTAVTQGLDPTVPMKESGVEWIGRIPAHWEVIPAWHAIEYISYGFTNPMPTTDDGPYMLTANDIGDGFIKYDTARHTTIEAYQELTAKSRPIEGDILLTKDGTLGRIAVCDGNDACINQSVALLRTNTSSVTVDFLQNLLRAEPYQEYLRFDAGGTTIKHIYITRVVKMRLAIPSKEEQDSICNYIFIKRNELNELIAETEASITTLQEYRAALIASAVTGQIDVRHLSNKSGEHSV